MLAMRDPRTRLRLDVAPRVRRDAAVAGREVGVAAGRDVAFGVRRDAAVGEGREVARGALPESLLRSRGVVRRLSCRRADPLRPPPVVELAFRLAPTPALRRSLPEFFDVVERLLFEARPAAARAREV